MPTYNYKCTECPNKFEAQQRMSDNNLTMCHECKQPTLKRVISGNPVIFKGDGWEGNVSKGKWHDPKGG